MAITKAYEIGEFGINLVVDSAGNVSSLAIDTTDVPEGTRLYYTDTRARNAISVSGNLTYDSATGILGFTMPTTIASLSNHDTDGLAEGTSNLYFTSARARSSLIGGTGISYTPSTGSIALATSGVTADTYGSSTQIPAITVDAYGRVTSVTNNSIVVGNATITISGGTDLETLTPDQFTLNQGTNETITIDHSAVSRTDTTSTATATHSGTVDVVDSVTTSATGHVTAVNVKTVTWPAGAVPNDATITIAGGTDLETGGDFTVDQAANETITLNHSNVTRTDTTSTDSPAHSGTFEAVTSVTTSATGHVTTIDVSTITLPAESDTLDSVTTRGNTTTNNITVNDINVNGNAVIEGDLTVNGTTTTIDVTNLAISDNFIYLNDGNGSTTNVDLGWAGGYNDGTYAHAGIFRDASDGVFKVFDSYTPEPDAAVDIDTSHASFALADLGAGNGYYTGSLGVGTASPATKLHVYGNNGENIRWGYNTSVYGSLQAGTAGTALDVVGANSGYGLQFKMDGTEHMRLLPTGRFGIGTTAPASKLHVVGAGNENIRIESNNNGSPYFGLYTNSTERAYYQYVNGSGAILQSDTSLKLNVDSKNIVFADITNTTFYNSLILDNPDQADPRWKFYSWASGLNIYPIDAASTVWFGRDGQTTHLTTSGYIGANLGSSNPGYPLHVNGSAYVSDDLLVQDSAEFERGANPIRIGDGFGSGGSATIHKYQQPLYLQYNNGNSVDELRIGGGGTSVSITDHQNASYRLNSGSGNSWTNADGGNFGIGTSGPRTPVEVNAPVSSGSQTGASVSMFLSDTTTATQGLGGGIGFAGSVTGYTEKVCFGTINGIHENSDLTKYDGALTFKTRAHSGALTEKVRIASTGGVGIGTNSPGTWGEKLKVSDSGTFVAAFERTDGTPHLLFKNSTRTDTGRFYLDDQAFQVSQGNATGGLSGNVWIHGASGGEVAIGTSTVHTGTALTVDGRTKLGNGFYQTFTGYRTGNAAAFDMFDIVGPTGQGFTRVTLDFGHAGGGMHGAYRRFAIKTNGYTDINLLEDFASEYGGGLGFTISRPNNSTIRIRWNGATDFADAYYLTVIVESNHQISISNIGMSSLG